MNRKQMMDVVGKRESLKEFLQGALICLAIMIPTVPALCWLIDRALVQHFEEQAQRSDEAVKMALQQIRKEMRAGEVP